MPIHNYTCTCGNVFDELHTSFGAAERAEKAGVPCPLDCGGKTTRNTNPNEALKTTNPLPKRSGLHTYK